MMNKTIADKQQRDEALDPSRSFIIQAPAGSGKTELLTRRFLKLLSIVEKDPEEILAITFTRKAAEEMRSRIINILKNPEKSELAQEALQRNEELQWHLIENPNRLRIQTIDALCKQIVNQAPILSRFGCSTNISDDAPSLYDEAALATLKQIDDPTCSRALITLLSHLDNRFKQVKQLLSSILAKREQWLPLIVKMRSHLDARKTLETALFTINQDILQTIHRLCPVDVLDELITLTQFAQQHCDQCQCDTNVLSQEKDFQLQDTLITLKNSWLAIANLLLTKNHTYRLTVDKKIGFPDPKKISNSQEKLLAQNMKERMKALLIHLSSMDELRETLESLRNAPSFSYTDQQWSVLNALLKLLPLAVGHLKLIFRSKSVTDFSEIAEAARFALGSPENPTDIALKLDYKIRHILFDEFQDTSNAQFALLEQLTEGWEPNDGRTLFIVGDPMQSIYRFRDAEVGLFIKAQHEGIGNIALTPLELSVNFRSDAAIIQWINHVGQTIFPPYESMDSGAVAYNAFSTVDTSLSDNNHHDAIHLHPIASYLKETEAEKIVAIIRETQTIHPDHSIAILVRARNHLHDILKLLRQHNIPYQAVEIDHLEKRSVIQDLFALTKALLHFADRIAWLSILRAPWCGLTLQDLHSIAHTDEHKTIWELIHLSSLDSTLTEDGIKRLHKLKIILSKSFEDQHQYNLRDWIYRSWIQLDGLKCIQQASDIEDAETYFKLLETYETAGNILDFEELANKINQLFASPNTTTNHAIQVMTIHKAKGLEFDTVIMPSLERKSPSQDSQLLLWMERTRPHDHKDLILAPIKSAYHQEDAIYHYVSFENKLKNQHETSRLLYVALTRAKHHLHLIGSQQIKLPLEGSFLGLLWPLVKESFNQKKLIDETIVPVNPKKAIQRKLRRLPLSYFNVDATQTLTIEQFIQKEQLATYDFSQQTAAKIGTCIHQIFEQITREGLTQWTVDRIKTLAPHWELHLLELNIQQDELNQALQQVMLAIQNIITDEKGRWILSRHQNAHSEFEITCSQNGSMHRYVIDRTFIDDSRTLWIIDYKTGSSSENEIALYHEQLHQYAEAMKALHHGPIRCALYFPQIPSFEEII